MFVSAQLRQHLVGADRVLAVLAELARHPEGVALEELVRTMDAPKPTVHRALASLCAADFAIKQGRGRYILGDEFLRLAFANFEARPDHVRVTPVLAELAERYGETAHYGVLDDDTIVYRSKADPAFGAVKLTSVVGGRNPAHSTGVGKMLLACALRDDDAVIAWAHDRALERRTARTITTAAGLAAELRRIRAQGYAVDDQENETGIVCVAIPVFLGSPSLPSGAISISAPAYRTPLTRLVEQLPVMRTIVGGLGGVAA